MDGMPERFIVANTCQDRCVIQKTGADFEGCPVYRCPGCDSRWYDPEKKRPAKPYDGVIQSLRDRVSGRSRR